MISNGLRPNNANNLSKSGEAEIKVLVELFQKLAESYMKNDIFHVRQRLWSLTAVSETPQRSLRGRWGLGGSTP